MLTLPTVPGARAAEPPTPVTYEGELYPWGTTSPTQDKPQSKLWFNDGSWWALMRTTSGITVHRLGTDHRWTDTGTVVDERLSSTGDALWEAGKLFVASRGSSGGVRVVRLSYDGGGDRYTVDFSKQVAAGSTESVSIARDTQDRLWVTYTQGKPRRVLVAHTTTDHATWTAPVPLPVPDNTVANDDVAAIAAFSGRIGVLWSDQGDEKVLFAFHQDGDPDGDWTVETAASGPNMADDHLNLKSLIEDDQGRIFAAVKTSRGDDGEPATDPLIQVLRRSADGSWASVEVSTVGDGLTRPQLVLDSTNDRVFVFMATEAGGTIYYKAAPLDTLAFPPGRGDPFVEWPGTELNNPTTAKHPVTAATGLVVLASHNGAHRYYHAEMALGPDDPGDPDVTPPSVPEPLTATATSPTSVDLSWPAATDDVGVTGYLLTRDGGAAGTVAGTSHSDTGLTADTSYTYTVSAIDAAGNRSAESAPVTVTTLPDDVPPPSSGPVTFVSAASVNSTGNSIAVPGPAGVENGDLLVAAVSVRGEPAITAPEGWTQVRLDTGSSLVQAVYIRVADGSSTSSTWTLNQAQPAVVQVLAYRGVDTTDPVVSSAGQPTNGPTMVSPAVTTLGGSAVLTVAGIAKPVGLTPDTALTERSEDTSTSANKKISANVADVVVTGTAAGPYSTQADDDGPGIAQTVALRPGPDSSGPDTTAPSVPGAVTATATSPTTVDLTWDAATDDTAVTEYRILRDDVQIGTSTTASFDDTGLTPETAYSYTVVAVDAAGNASGPSAPAPATTPAETVDPAGPVTFIAAASVNAAGSSIAVPGPAGAEDGDLLVAAVSVRGAPVITAPAGWTPVRSDSTGGMLQAVYVRRVDSSGENPSTSSIWTLDQVQPAVVQVLAYRGVDTTDPVVSSAGRPTTDTSLTSPAVTTVDGSAVITVAGLARVATLTPEPALTERSENASNSENKRISADAADVVVSGTAAGPYVTTADSGANGIAQTVALRPSSGTAPGEAPDTTPPTTPGAVTATASSPTAVDVTWDAATDDTAVTGYRILRDDVQIGTSTTTSYADTGLTPETTYSYTVVAVDAAGNASSPSARAPVTTPAEPAPDTTPPSIPGTVTATATSPTTVDLTWDAATDDTAVTEYRILRDDVQIGTSTTTSYADTGLTPETTYSYTVVALDAAGNASGPSAPAPVTTPAGSVDPTEPITFVAASTAEAAGESVTAPAPAGIQVGDVLVATVSVRGVPVITAPEEWTLVRYDENASAMRQAVYVTGATGTEVSWTWTLDRSQTAIVQVLAYRGVDTANPVVVAAGQLTEGSTLTSPAVPAVEGAAVLTFAGITRPASLEPDAPVTERSEISSTVGTSRISADAGEIIAAGATAGPFVTTASREASGIAQTVVLRPAP